MRSQAAGISRTDSNEVGAYAYHCTIHPSIVGEIDVRRVTFDRVPPAAVPVGTRVELTGRTADPSQPVLIEEAAGTDFKLVGKASPAADGSWKTVVTALATADLRAVSGSDASETRRLLVASRRVVVRPTKTGVSVTVTPRGTVCAAVGRGLPPRALRLVARRSRHRQLPLRGGHPPTTPCAGACRARRQGRLDAARYESDDHSPEGIAVEPCRLRA